MNFIVTLFQEENVVSHIKNYTKEEAKSEYKKHHTNLNDKLRLLKKEDSKKARYRIVNCFRSIEDEDEDEEKQKLTIFDLETDCNENNETIENKNKVFEPNYVYDLYYTNSDDLGDANLDEYIR